MHMLNNMKKFYKNAVIISITNVYYKFSNQYRLKCALRLCSMCRRFFPRIRSWQVCFPLETNDYVNTLYVGMMIIIVKSYDTQTSS